MNLKISVVQLAPEVGHLKVNLNKIKEKIDEAKKQKADLALFPSMCLGDCYGDKLYSYEFRNELLHCNDEIGKMSKDIHLVWGNIAEKENKIFKAIYYAYDGVVKHVQFSHVLNNQQTSFESRYFSKINQDYDVISIEKGNVKNKILFGLENELFDEECLNKMKEKKNDYFIHLDSRSWTIEGEDEVFNQAKKLMDCGLSKQFIHVNCAGMQNTGKNVLIYDGKSFVYSDDEKVCFLNDGFKEEMALIEKQFDHRISNKLLNGLVVAIREFDRQILPYQPKWIIGLSGGLDSSVNAALLTMALGKDRICAYNLATRYNSENTKVNAANQANALGIELRNGYISDVVEATVNTLKIYGYQDEQMPTLVHENIQARIRGHMLSSFAQIENGVIVNNGNKIEVALGYATLYGDAIGALGPIGDLTKVQLFELAHQINAEWGKEVVPERLLPIVEEEKLIWEMAPSAELKDNQYDPMKWFYHDWLISQLTDKNVDVEEIMEAYLKDKLQSSEVARWIQYYHLDQGEAFIQDLEWVLRQMRLATFKRIQSVPIVKVSRNAYGSNCLEVQGSFDATLKYQELKALILNMK